MGNKFCIPEVILCAWGTSPVSSASDLFFTYCIGMIYSIGNAYFSPLDLKQKSSCRFCFRRNYLYLWAQRQYSSLAYSDLQSRVHIVLRGKGERFLCLVCFRKHSISTWKKQNQKTFLQPWVNTDTDSQLSSLRSEDALLCSRHKCAPWHEVKKQSSFCFYQGVSQ